jgi:lipooligosaccharide transport system permease protein
MTEVVPPSSTGRVVGPVRAGYLVLEQCFTWYRKNWKATVFSSVGMPVLFLLAMGLGFGSQVRAGSVPGGVSYLVYLTPALLPNGAVQTATFESTYPILSGFVWSRTFWGMTATPVTPGQVVTGMLLWLGARLVVSGVVFVAVAAALGAATGPGILLSLVFGVLTGLAFGAPLMAFSAVVDSTGNAFNVVFRFILVPMSLFAGTFFPINQLPAWVRPVAWLTPLWHGTELARAGAFGTLTPLSTLLHVGYLLAMFVVGVLLARWRFRLRLAR